MKLLEMDKDMKIKHSVSFPLYKVWGNCFCKKVLHGETNFLGQIYGGMLYMETNDQIVHRGKLGRVKLVFLPLTLTLVIDIFEKLTPQSGD